ncbi:alpha/beta fold hydrolase [Streptomyces fulvorobeus]|uniref:Hydrolase n=1 Tax=Streptomyces fulvorobeus TaxID=284028 RepID=A0A7J0BYJ3_9ACTN|nr:alpha/beta hydrolase [Streptomyces fulvorobeus]NYE39102.1 pimeloyl-ACP methyl ester carboxylesterase [Streptomyces fulvorobeus]GFM95302.1 hydrolase [Streptomyces fulvorobeus]
MAEFVSAPGGTIAYEAAGEGPLVVLAHGMGDSRTAYRFVLPRLVAAGYRVAAVDLRGCGESSAQWPSYSRTDIAGDLLGVIRHLDSGPAVLVGHSISGGAATIAAAQDPDLVRGIIELGPFTRAQSIKLGDFRSKSYRKGAFRLLGASLFGSVGLWSRYLDHAYPDRKPADWSDRLARIEAMLGEPGRMRAMQKMGQSAPTDAGAQLGNVRCPALIVQGSLDPDWVDPRAEGEAIVAAMPAGVGELAVVEGAGHYPHDQYPEETVSLMLTFLGAHARA